MLVRPDPWEIKKGTEKSSILVQWGSKVTAAIVLCLPPTLRRRSHNRFKPPVIVRVLLAVLVSITIAKWLFTPPTKLPAYHDMDTTMESTPHFDDDRIHTIWANDTFECLQWQETKSCGVATPRGELAPALVTRKCNDTIEPRRAGFCQVRNKTSGAILRFMVTTCHSVTRRSYTCDLARAFSEFALRGQAYQHIPMATSLALSSSSRPTRAILMVVYTKVLPSAYAAIRLLRAVHGCRLPIEMWYRPDEMVDIDTNRLVQRLVVHENVHLRAIFDPRATGFYTKPHAIFYSRYDQVLLLDADNLPVRDPSYLFDEPLFKTHGALFWPDFWQPANSLFDVTAHNLVWQLVQMEFAVEFEQESGQVLVDRRRAPAALNKLMYLSTSGLLDALQLVWGDKDLFRLAWRNTGTSYHMMQRPPAIGGLYNEARCVFCGLAIVQYDPQGHILFVHRNSVKLDGSIDQQETITHLQEFHGDSSDAYRVGQIMAELDQESCYYMRSHETTITPIGETPYAGLERAAIAYSIEGRRLLEPHPRNTNLGVPLACCLLLVGGVAGLAAFARRKAFTKRGSWRVMSSTNDTVRSKMSCAQTSWNALKVRDSPDTTRVLHFVRTRMAKKRASQAAKESAVAKAPPTRKEPHHASNDDASVSSVEDDTSDLWSIAILMVLYTLQGIPMGLSSSVPFLLQGKVGYAEQATFSLVSWPFSLKLLWAPIVDSIYVESFGRRKSWLIPVQLVCAVLMILGGPFVGTLLDMDEPDVHLLTLFFFALYFLMATQDIAVDGWALTMLSPKNVEYASTCNTIGQTLGYFIAYVGFLALNDAGTCNSYLRAVPDDAGLVTLPGFMTFWGYVMLVTTLVVWVAKREKPDPDHNLTIAETYHQMWTVIQLPSVLALTAVQLTVKVAFAATDAVSSLKLVEYGVQKEKLALLTPILVPLGLVLPVLITSRMNKDTPLQLFLTAIPFRLVVGVVYAGLVYVTPLVMSHSEDVHYYYYALVLVAGALHEVSATMMYVPQMAFFAKVSDPTIGGTYMTFLNTISNLGSKWPNSLSLAFVDTLSTKLCSVDAANACSDHDAKHACEAMGGHCHILTDGYFVETAVCTAIGVMWLIVAYRHVDKLQKLPMSAWRVAKGKKTN
ncbi:Aste57867_11102 [Aphanomyces stellatus]|uniref:Aste57867_11102 protein n=1 Tax=Aphanomyces stellatus TaxID=120398 RepID=A0A485KSR7_9STRA|nr:hypothetical protein As57867_011060 [Aphanomyces stellatus]VFT87969.1 Aste57867_11102 [Aphanomyces stellatus]